MQFLEVLLWIHVSGTEKGKGEGKRKAGQESKKRTERICLHFFFFPKQIRACFGCAPSRHNFLYTHYQQRLGCSGLLTMATLFTVWSSLMATQSKGSQLCSLKPEETRKTIPGTDRRSKLCLLRKGYRS